MAIERPRLFDRLKKGLEEGIAQERSESMITDKRVSPRRIDKMQKVNLAEKLAKFQDHWNPRIVGELNGQHVKLVKFQGEFVWHKHDNEDEMFLVVNGQFRMELEDQPAIELEEGEFLIVPRGMVHRPVAEEEVSVLLFEPAGTLNTGDAATSTLTVAELESL
ncbi:MAG: Cupin domain protein [Chthonomonadales bacterium]|nr:Cupin domain protein [Chthonomonadales bacterium]